MCVCVCVCVCECVRERERERESWHAHMQMVPADTCCRWTGAAPRTLLERPASSAVVSMVRRVRGPVSRRVSGMLPAAPAVAAAEDSAPCAVSATRAPLKAWSISSIVGVPHGVSWGGDRWDSGGTAGKRAFHTDCGMRPGREHSGRKVFTAVPEFVPPFPWGHCVPGSGVKTPSGFKVEGSHR